MDQSSPILFIFMDLVILYYMHQCFIACIHVHQWWLQSDEGVGVPETRVTDDCEQPCKFWGLSLCCLQEQQMLLTTEYSLYL